MTVPTFYSPAPYVEPIDVRRWLVPAPRYVPPAPDTPMMLRLRELAAAGMDWREATAVMHREVAENIRAAKPKEWEPVALPAPVVRAREAGEGDPMPRNVESWRARAEAAGWTCRVVYSRGWAINARGEPTALVDAVTLRMMRGGDRAVAMWQDGRAAGAWRWERGGWPVRVGHEALKRESAGQST